MRFGPQTFGSMGTNSLFTLAGKAENGKRNFRAEQLQLLRADVHTNKSAIGKFVMVAVNWRDGGELLNSY